MSWAHDLGTSMRGGDSVQFWSLSWSGMEAAMSVRLGLDYYDAGSPSQVCLLDLDSLVGVASTSGVSVFDGLPPWTGQGSLATCGTHRYYKVTFFNQSAARLTKNSSTRDF